MTTLADALLAKIEQATVTVVVTDADQGVTFEAMEVYDGKRGSTRLLVNQQHGVAIASNADGQAVVRVNNERAVNIAVAACRAVQKVMDGKYDAQTLLIGS